MSVSIRFQQNGFPAKVARFVEPLLARALSSMTIASMTGFARTAGVTGPHRWAWELRSVNARGLDVRLRVPPGYDAEAEAARQAIGKRLGRGACHVNLTVEANEAVARVRINEALLQAAVAALARLAVPKSVGPLSLDGLLAMRGVVETVGDENDAAMGERLAADLRQAFVDGLEALVAMRRAEGDALDQVLRRQLDAIARLTRAAEDCPARRPEAIRAKLAEQVAALLDASAGLDPQRLHQEAVMLATRADIREEIDRLDAHVAAARALMSEPGPVGRRLDFLAQEFSREANTLCAKANDVTLSAIGLELKSVVEQFREQVQNVE